jgi:hypothetical protein
MLLAAQIISADPSGKCKGSGRQHPKDGESKIAILPEGQIMNSTYFIECVPCPLTELCYPQGRGTHERRVMLHSDDASIHNTEGIQKSLANFGFRRMEYPP